MYPSQTGRLMQPLLKPSGQNKTECVFCDYPESTMRELLTIEAEAKQAVSLGLVSVEINIVPMNERDSTILSFLERVLKGYGYHRDLSLMATFRKTTTGEQWQTDLSQILDTTVRELLEYE
jgi:hypothetical protein